MPFAPFYKVFRDVAREETRSLILLQDDGGVPAGEYILTELYCDEPGCDCRRVVFQVWVGETPTSLNIAATISFGWEPESFYRKWASFPLSKEDMDELKGPGLMRLATQSDYADELLRHVKIVLNSELYVERLVRHYKMYREVVERRGSNANRTVVRSAPKPGMNQPCPCGSGKKYKRCCWGRAA